MIEYRFFGEDFKATASRIEYQYADGREEQVDLPLDTTPISQPWDAAIIVDTSKLVDNRVSYWDYSAAVLHYEDNGTIAYFSLVFDDDWNLAHYTYEQGSDGSYWHFGLSFQPGEATISGTDSVQKVCDPDNPDVDCATEFSRFDWSKDWQYARLSETWTTTTVSVTKTVLVPDPVQAVPLPAAAPMLLSVGAALWGIRRARGSAARRKA